MGATFYLVRHAKAEADAPGGDAARRLTPEGRDRFAALLAALAPKLRVRRVLASPFARARETADLLAAACGATVEEEAALASGRSSGAELLALARREGDGVALVGHNPEIADAVALVAGRDEKVRPGTVAEAEVRGGAVALRWIEAPPKDA